MQPTTGMALDACGVIEWDACWGRTTHGIRWPGDLQLYYKVNLNGNAGTADLCCTGGKSMTPAASYSRTMQMGHALFMPLRLLMCGKKLNWLEN